MGIIYYTHPKQRWDITVFDWIIMKGISLWAIYNNKLPITICINKLWINGEPIYNCEQLYLNLHCKYHKFLWSYLSNYKYRSYEFMNIDICVDICEYLMAIS